MSHCKNSAYHPHRHSLLSAIGWIRLKPYSNRFLATTVWPHKYRSMNMFGWDRLLANVVVHILFRHFASIHKRDDITWHTGVLMSHHDRWFISHARRGNRQRLQHYCELFIRLVYSSVIDIIFEDGLNWCLPDSRSHSLPLSRPA